MKRILIVEDNVTIAMAMVMELESSGYEVAGPAVTNAQALELARADPVDLALVDVDLHGGDSGVELVGTLHRELGVPCLFVTGQGTQASEPVPGAFGVLAKPFKIRALRAAVAGALDYAGGGPRPAAEERVVWF